MTPLEDHFDINIKSNGCNMKGPNPLGNNSQTLRVYMQLLANLSLLFGDCMQGHAQTFGLGLISVGAHPSQTTQLSDLVYNHLKLHYQYVYV